MRSKSNKVRSTTKDLFASLSLNIIVNLLLYVGQLLIARRLLREEYATFSVVVSYVSIAALFADLGLTGFFIRKFAEAQTLAASGRADMRGELLGSFLAFRIGVSLIVSIAALVIARILGYPQDILHLMLIMLVTLFISSRLLVVRSVGEAFLRGHNKYQIVALFTAIDAFVFAGALYFSAKSFSLENAVWIYSFCHVPGFILLFGLIFRYSRSIGFKLRVRVHFLKEMIVQGFPLILSTLFLTTHSQADILLINGLSTPKEVSAFAAGLRILTATVFIPAVFSAVIGPSVTQAVVTGSYDTIRGTLDRALRLLLLGALAIAVVLSVSSDSILAVLFGSNKFADAAPLVIVFGWTFIPICFGAFITDIAVAEGKFWVVTFHTGFLVVASISCDLLLIPGNGAFGAAIAKCIAVSLGSIFVFFISAKLHVFVRRQMILLFTKLAGTTILTLGIIFAVQYLHLPTVMQMFIVLISFSLFALVIVKVISMREISLLFSNLMRRAKLEPNG